MNNETKNVKRKTKNAGRRDFVLRLSFYVSIAVL